MSYLTHLARGAKDSNLNSSIAYLAKKTELIVTYGKKNGLISLKSTIHIPTQLKNLLILPI